MITARTPMPSWVARMLDGIRRNGGRIIVTKRPAEFLTLYNRADGQELNKEVVQICIAEGFLVPDDNGLFGDDPATYRLADRLP